MERWLTTSTIIGVEFTPMIQKTLALGPSIVLVVTRIVDCDVDGLLAYICVGVGFYAEHSAARI